MDAAFRTSASGRSTPRALPPGGSHWASLSRREPALRREAYDALLTMWMDALERIPVQQWPRKPAASEGFEAASHSPRTLTGLSLDAAQHQGRFADAWYTVIPLFREQGVNPALLARMKAWGKTMWPSGNWQSL